ncbi:pantetheine-phosphate adenylyltransferase [Angustibacter sp. McL0619]|uniref:pantetheine-phosphate adenylyltransferase n=1 Tax=Angustibacter sp. McL0619 TaxID=3415676 RepID=UPI003CECCFFA
MDADLSGPRLRRCVCPGSYDPVTLGHLDIVARAGELFDEVVVAVLYNPDKSGTFSADERVELLRASLGDRPGVRVEQFAARLLVDVCDELGAGHVVKGLRSGADLEYERPMALMNRHLTGLETIFVVADPQWQHVSSTLVRQVSAYGGDVSGLVPEVVLEALAKRRG